MDLVDPEDEPGTGMRTGHGAGAGAPADMIGPTLAGAAERALGDFTTTPAILRLVPLAILIGRWPPASPWRCST